MRLSELIAVVDSWEDIRIYDTTGIKDDIDDIDFKCIYSGTVEKLDFTIVFDNYIVERIALDLPFIVIMVAKKG